MGRLFRQTDFPYRAAYAEKLTTYAGEHILSLSCAVILVPPDKTKI